MNVRPSPIAGSWYPRAPARLRALLERLLAQAQPAPAGRVVGLLAPHAGMMYSGAVAARAFGCLRGASYDLVVVLGPRHEPDRGPLLTTVHTAYATPLGLVPVSVQALAQLDEALRAAIGVGLTPVARDSEHSIEIALPFLQHVLGAFDLVPVMLRTRDATALAALGHALASLLAERNALLVASSDLSHYYPQEVAQALDRALLRRVEALDPQAVLRAEDEGVGYACGSNAIAALLWAAHDLGARQVQVLHYATSGDATGDTEAVVGYAAAAIMAERRAG